MKEINIHIAKELEEAPLLLGLKQGDAQFFRLPDGYFEGLSARILEKAQGNARDEAAVFGDGQQLSQLEAMPMFDVPGGYFENFAERLQGKIEEEEMGILAQLKGKQFFSVPEGYFDRFPDALKTKLKAPKQVTIVRMWSLRIAAAVVILLGLVGLFTSMPSGQDQYVYLENEKVSEEAFFTLVDEENFGIDELASHLSFEELAEIESEIAPILPEAGLEDLINDLELSDLEDLDFELN